LAARHNAVYAVYAGSEFELKLQADSLKDQDVIPLGKTKIEVLRTPGHTPGSICYLIADRYLISGDTLFTTSVGRPDLGGRAAEWAKSLYHTLREKVGMLSPDVRVFPAHYSSASEICPDGTVSARLGDLRERLPEFHAPNEGAFVEAMVHAVKTPPSSYAEIIRTNLGALSPDVEHMTEWELGKNECAASHH
jgi:glyoxylase-like metal-dependent hydrolase (beta-lactamase superfamily II)